MTIKDQPSANQTDNKDNKPKEVRIRRFVLEGCGLVLLYALICVVLGFLIALPGHQDRAAIAERYTQFNKSFNNGNYEMAYSFMSPTYRQTHTIERFKSDFDFLTILDGEPLEPGYSVILSGNKASLSPDGPRWGLGIVWSGREYELEKIGGVWYFTGKYEFYLD